MPPTWSIWPCVATIARTRQAMFVEHGANLIDVIAGIDDDGLFGALVAEDDAVAHERADRDGLDDHRVTSVSPAPTPSRETAPFR